MSGLPCWRHHGVWGRERPRCSRLDEVIHCRNCPEYIGQGRALLERLAQQRLMEETGRDDGHAPPSEEALRTPGLLVFRVNGNWLALPAAAIHQVAPRSPLRPLPHQRHSPIRGLVNVAGRLWVCLSLSDTLGIPRIPRQVDDPTRSIFERLVAVEAEGLRFAFRAGEVRGIYRAPQPLPITGSEDLPPLAVGAWEVEVRRGEQVHCAVLDGPAVWQRVREYLA